MGASKEQPERYAFELVYPGRVYVNSGTVGSAATCANIFFIFSLNLLSTNRSQQQVGLIRCAAAKQGKTEHLCIIT